jgi:hypothetical protein
MNLRHLGAGALALAMLVFVLSTPPATAQTCQRLDRSRGAIATVPCLQADEGRAVKRDRRHFREGRKARGGLVSPRVPAGVAADRAVAQTDNDGRIVAGPAGEPVRLARGRASAGIEPGAGRVAEILPHPPGCPRRAFCGCGAAVRIFGAPVRALWLAANWFKFPPAPAAPGMVAVRRGHVFVIEAVVGPGRVVAYDANSGRGLTRRHVRSLAGYSVRDPRASS